MEGTLALHTGLASPDPQVLELIRDIHYYTLYVCCWTLSPGDVHARQALSLLTGYSPSQ